MPDLSKDNIRYLLTLPPQDIVNWYKSKGYRFSWRWQDTWQEAHARAFTAAKAMKLDILQTIKKKVDEIFSKGITYDQFKKDLEPELKKSGWWGKVRADQVPGYDPSSGVDPNKIVQLGSPRRLKIIYEVNANVAWAAGRWKSFQENSESRSYLQYHQIDRKSKRRSHSKFDGKFFRVDDPIWSTIYPPNGWLCGCYVTAHQEDELEGEVSKGENFIKAAHKNIPPEWQYNPGQSFLNPINDKIRNNIISIDDETIKLALAKSIVDDFEKERIFEKLVDDVLRDYKTTGRECIVGLINKNIILKIEARGLKAKSDLVFINDYQIAHSFRESKPAAKGLTINEFKSIPAILKNPGAVLFDKENPSLLYVFPASNKTGKIIIRMNYDPKKKGFLSNKNYIINTGAVESYNLRERRYELLYGEI